MIPVFNSEAIVGSTIDACRRFFEDNGLSYEIVAVNDGSLDRSWDVLKSRADAVPRMIAVNLLRNYGQHTAVLCGLRLSRGNRVVTIDDDLQNPPEEIARLIEMGDQGHDLVFGLPRLKRHHRFRRWGSRIVNALNRRVFDKPRDLVLTNFRLIDRVVVERILAHRTHDPYINGLAVLYAHAPVNVPVDHRPREAGSSNYGVFQIAAVVSRILFNYSSYPLRAVSFLGLVVAGVSFVLAGYFFVRGLIFEPTVPGWASVAFLLAFFNGVSLLLLGMLGEYLLRILRHVSQEHPYHVLEIHGARD